MIPCKTIPIVRSKLMIKQKLLAFSSSFTFSVSWGIFITKDQRSVMWLSISKYVEQIFSNLALNLMNRFSDGYKTFWQQRLRLHGTIFFWALQKNFSLSLYWQQPVHVEINIIIIKLTELENFIQIWFERKFNELVSCGCE